VWGLIKGKRGCIIGVVLEKTELHLRNLKIFKEKRRRKE